MPKAAKSVLTDCYLWGQCEVHFDNGVRKTHLQSETYALRMHPRKSSHIHPVSSIPQYTRACWTQCIQCVHG